MGRLDLEARRTTGGRSARETRASSGRRSDGARSAPSLVGLGAGALVSLALLAPARAAGKKDPAGAQAPVWATRPSLEQTYADYRPAFCTGGPESEGLKFSRQGRYLNMGDVRMDAEVRPIIDKANETAFRKKEPRKATELYRRIIEDYPGDMIQIAEQGVFVPAALYVQRKILRYPEKELDYYRVLYDPAAKEIYRRALKRYSIFDYKDLADYHLATSYGDDALFALGNNAVDKGQYDEARRYYERIVTYHGLEDTDRDAVHLDRDHVWARLAICCRHLGLEKKFRAAVGRIEDKEQPVVARLLEQLEKLEYDAFAVRQREGRRSARYDAMDDRKLSEPLPYEFSANRGEWRAALKRRPLRWQQAVEPEPLPWATETDLIYKDLNILHSRSLLTGELNWVFGPGGSSFDWDRYRSGGWASRHRVDYYPDQSILVHDGVVLAHMFVYGPSLVAVDQHTGRLLWAKGPMAATSEEEWLDRYQASPAGARGMVVAPVVHDDIRGRTHISSSAELAAFETRSGKRLWQTRLSQISPLKITQSRYPRKIRVFSTTPLVKDGVVYHVTNAGVVAAVDARTGRARWLTRYPQKKQALDNLTGPGRVWRNEPPLVHGDRLYVTPVDSPFLLCLDKDNGRILWVATRDADSTWPARGHTRFPTVWRMIGLTTEGRLCLVGRDIVFLDPETGRLVWKLGAHDMWGPRGRFIRKRVPKGLEAGITGEGKDYWTNLGSVHARPTLTRDGKMWYAMQGWYLNPFPYQGPFNSEYCLDLASREIVLQRRWYHPPCFINDHQRNPPVIKRVVNEEPEPFHPAARMCFRRWDVPFEVDVTFNHIAVRYDRDRMRKVLARRKDLNTLFAKAEVARKQGDVQGAIRQYEQCKPLLPSEEEDRRRTINLRLYPLYTELARWGHQSADYDFLEAACKKMGATASSAGQEIRALLAYAELHEKKGRWLRAVQVLQNASRHYWREPLPVSRLELGRREELIDTARKGLENLLGEIPAPYRQEGRQILRLERAALGDYFLSVANVDASYVVEARTLVAKRIRELLARAPGGVRQQYEKRAAADLQRDRSVGVGERLLWCWPESEAAKTTVRELAAKTAGMKPVEQQAMRWRLADLAGACGLDETLVPHGMRGLSRAPAPSGLAAGARMKQVEVKNPDPDTVRLALPQTGDVERTRHLLFVGGRKRRAYGNRFTVLCWNMKTNEQEWLSREILLHGKADGGGYEVGFEQVLIHEGLALVHGRHDVVALDCRPGRDLDATGKKEKRWHFRVSPGFEIHAAKLCGDVLVLCGRGSTVAISPRTGEILWDASEAGEFYAGPFFHEDVMLTLRRSPAEVSFRKVGSGRLVCRLALPGLTTNRKHPMFSLEGTGDNPAAAEAVEAYPVAFAEGHVAVSDGNTYHVVDVARRRVRWSRPASKLDPSQDPAYRMWIDGGRLFVLKPYYAVLENVVFDLASGDMLWRRREGGKKQDARIKKFEKERGEEPGDRAATGLVLSSMTFLDGKVYGIKYQMGTTSVELVGMDPASGEQVMKVKESGYDAPEACVEPSWSEECVVVRIQDGNRFELWQVDVKAGKIVQRLALKGYGRLGEYGDVSMVWQGPYQAIWAFDSRKFTVPAK